MTISRTTPGTSGRIAALLTTAAMVAFGASAAPAQAESNESITVRGGKVSFIGHGEGLAARDTRKDGRCMQAHLLYSVFTGDPTSPWHDVNHDVRVCGAGKSDLRRLSIPEGTKVSLWACYIKFRAGKAYEDGCSDVQYATA